MTTLQELSDVSQRVSDIYAQRFGIERDSVWHLAKLSEEMGELQAAYLKVTGSGRGEAEMQALADEVADLFAQLLLFANWQGIDIVEAVDRKWAQYLPKDVP
ncbi:MAG: MazG nucleotide pyrophosphohydrolase domain-containing protein [Paracoccaceae bacterium]